VLNAPAVEPDVRRAWRITIGLLMAGMLMGLLCVGSTAFAFRQQFNRGVVVVHVGRLILTAELTIDPTCASLAEDCLSHHRPNRYRYFSMWAYLTTPPTVPWQITYWHLITFRVGRGDQ
jgi:hypothetical protein